MYVFTCLAELFFNSYDSAFFFMFVINDFTLKHLGGISQVLFSVSEMLIVIKNSLGL